MANMIVVMTANVFLFNVIAFLFTYFIAYFTVTITISMRDINFAKNGNGVCFSN